MAIRKKLLLPLYLKSIFLTSQESCISSQNNVNTAAPTSHGGRPPVLSEEVKNKLDDFLCRNTISFTLPGRNNQIYIGKDENGENKFNSKKFILWTFYELASILSEEEDEDLFKLKFSIIYQYIKSKKEFIIQSKIPEVNCLCPVCESIELICEGINKPSRDISLPTKCHVKNCM